MSLRERLLWAATKTAWATAAAGFILAALANRPERFL